MSNFHGIDVIPGEPDKSLFHVIPVPLEQSVSYGGGTGKGPDAIIDASGQLELFDNKSYPHRYGIYTDLQVNCSGSIENALKNIENATARVLTCNKIPVLLGGEHTLTYGAIKALKEKFDNFGVIQFDAHADLRNSYEENKFSHACVMKRIFDENIPFMQLGTRSYSEEEFNLRKQYDIHYYDAEEIFKKGISTVKIPQNFPDKIYITIDIDVLDSSVMPATGTPVPGGLSWYQLMWLLEYFLKDKICIGFDLVEFLPIENFHAYDFTAAQIVYNTMGYITRNEQNLKFYGVKP